MMTIWGGPRHGEVLVKDEVTGVWMTPAQLEEERVRRVVRSERALLSGGGESQVQPPGPEGGAGDGAGDGAR